MTTTNIPQMFEKFEIQAYKMPGDLKSLAKTHVSFSGSPRKHPSDPEKVILVSDPFSSHKFYYEFRKNDITYAEKLPTLTSLDGEIIPIFRIWVKKMSLGVRCTPFLVEDIGSAKE